MRLLLALAAVSGLLFSCSPNNVTKDAGLSRLFDSAGLRGSAAIYDNGQGEFHVHNLSRFKDSAYTPGSSFHPVLALMGLKTGRVNNEGQSTTFDTATASLAQALPAGNEAWFAGLAKSLGKDTMQAWLDTLSYGRKPIANPIGFWKDGSIALTADEQLGFLKRLYFEQLPFDKRSMRLIRQSMVKEQNNLYTLGYHVGEGNTNGRKAYWLVGWIEENKHPYLFALHVDAPTGGQEPNLAAFAKALLNQQGLGYGKR